MIGDLNSSIDWARRRIHILKRVEQLTSEQQHTVVSVVHLENLLLVIDKYFEALNKISQCHDDESADPIRIAIYALYEVNSK